MEERGEGDDWCRLGTRMWWGCTSHHASHLHMRGKTGGLVGLEDHIYGQRKYTHTQKERRLSIVPRKGFVLWRLPTVEWLIEPDRRGKQGRREVGGFFFSFFSACCFTEPAIETGSAAIIGLAGEGGGRKGGGQLLSCCGMGKSEIGGGEKIKNKKSRL